MPVRISTVSWSSRSYFNPRPAIAARSKACVFSAAAFSALYFPKYRASVPSSALISASRS
jgi:hypothetical protein